MADKVEDKVKDPTSSQELGTDTYSAVFQRLIEKVPSSVKSDLPEGEQQSQQLIEKFNTIAAAYLLEILNRTETERLNQQKPLRTWLLVFVGFQMVACNLIIGYMVFNVCHNMEVESVASILSFFKYYIGVVLVELIGMIWFITKNTFTSSSQEIIKGFLGRINKQ